MEQAVTDVKQYPVIDLFPEDLKEEQPQPSETPGVNEFRRAFRAVAWYKRIKDTADTDQGRLIEEIEREIENVKSFYENKRKQAGERLAFWYSQLDVMMKMNNVTKMATPYGTSFYRSTKKKAWNGTDEELLSFARETGEKDLIRTKEYPDKKQIEAYIESTGKGADLLTVTPVTEVTVRLTDEAG